MKCSPHIASCKLPPTNLKLSKPNLQATVNISTQKYYWDYNETNLSRSNKAIPCASHMHKGVIHESNN